MADEVGELSSEFASVRVRIDTDGNGPRLRVEDLRTGHVGFLDPLELETLAWLPEGGLHKLLDPSLHRWRAEDQER
ncbi:MAG: hypothetical protein JWM31_1135 [Solirubrobacterales bacterium]|nr:hypothetical protein [Solirubrobacterales bacterium]